MQFSCSGTIPREIGLLQNITHLYLGDNKNLSGTEINIDQTI